MTKVARLYHEQGLKQPEIARRLHVSQPRVSRLLKQAEQEGIVRTTVVVPRGVQAELEEALELRYGLREAIVVQSLRDGDDVTRELGVAAAAYLEASLTGGDVVGISSWSMTLLAAVDAMRPLAGPGGADRAVQLFGGVGSPSAEAHAARLTQRFADLTGAQPTFVLAPGIAVSKQARAALVQDPFVAEALDALDEVTLALVGIGALEPSTLLQRSGNIFSESELRALGERGAVGDICLRFYDDEGRRVASDLDDRVIGVTLEQLRRVDRSVGIAGGRRKYRAILGALRGGWINVLITDQATAKRLTTEPSAAPGRGPVSATA